MVYHHDVHHAGYVSNLNAFLDSPAASGNAALQSASLTSIVMSVGSKPALFLGGSSLSADQTETLRNNAGGDWNHAFFWRLMTPNATALPGPNTSFAKAVAASGLGSMPDMIRAVNAAGAARFGSGWSWLVLNTTSGKLQVCGTRGWKRASDWCVSGDTKDADWSAVSPPTPPHHAGAQHVPPPLHTSQQLLPRVSCFPAHSFVSSLCPPL